MPIRRSPFDLLGLACLLAFGTALYFLYTAPLPDRQADPRAQILDTSSEVQAGHEWMTLTMEGSPVGFRHVLKERRGEGWRYFVETRFRLLGAAGGEVLTEVDAELAADLALQRFTFVVEAGPSLLRGRGEVKGETLALAVESGGEVSERTVPLEDATHLQELVGPRLARLGGLSISPGSRAYFPVFDPLTQRDGVQQVRVVGPSRLGVFGQEVPVLEVEVTLHGSTQRAWLNQRGEMLRQELGLGLLAVRETEEEARFAIVQARSGRAGADVRALASVAAIGMTDALAQGPVLSLRLGGVELEGLALADHRQTLEGAVLTIRREAVGPGRPLTPGGAGPLLAAEPLVQVDHPKIQATARRVVGDATDTHQAAERLLAFVHTHLEQAVVPGVPSALEVLEQKVGDCNEHAVLFAALARAAGVPTRIETGLAWQEGRFAWHAWNAVQLQDGWLTVDPTWNQMPVDVGHLRIASGGLAAQAELLRVVGRLELGVVPQ